MRARRQSQPEPAERLCELCSRYARSCPGSPRRDPEAFAFFLLLEKESKLFLLYRQRLRLMFELRPLIINDFVEKSFDLLEFFLIPHAVDLLFLTNLPQAVSLSIPRL